LTQYNGSKIFSINSNSRFPEVIYIIKKLLKGHKEVAKDLDDVINPFDVQTIRSFFQEDEENTLFSFDGPINDLIGPLKRGWLLGIMAPMKRGKSFWLAEIMVQALFNK